MRAIAAVGAIFVAGWAAFAQQPVQITGQQTMTPKAAPSAQAQPIPDWKSSQSAPVGPIPNWNSPAASATPIPSWRESATARTSTSVITLVRACVIVKDDGKRYSFIEGSLPGVAKMPKEFSDKDIHRVIEAGVRVEILGAHYIASDLAAARASCK